MKVGRAHPPAVAGLFGLLLCLALCLGRVALAAEPRELHLVEATLISAVGERQVSLPDVLRPSDFAPEGSRVRYRVQVALDAAPTTPLGIYVPKMSLGGDVHLNGAWVGSCALGDITVIRCLHQPQFFVPPPSLWRAGTNTLDFELFASARQANGLSSITVGPAEALGERTFARHYFVQVELLRGLAWSMVCFGVVSLALAALFRHRSDAGFFWFGITSLVNALCNLNVLVQSPTVSVAFFAWFVFSARLVSVPLLMLTVLTFFRQATVPRQRALVGSVLVMPAVVWMSGIDTGWVSLMYLPFLFLAPVLLAAAVVWTYRSRRPRDALVAGVLLALVAAGIHDWVKFSGVAAFERTYLLSYANALTLLVMGGVIVATLADALRRSRASAALLSARVAEKEAELRGHYAERLAYEQQSARYAERDRLLRDMHDGMGSSLSTARILLASGRITVTDAAQVLQECIDDLRLMIEASGNPEGDLEAALADFRFRIEQRLEPESVVLAWRVALDGIPSMPTDDLLQLMRIVQEALNNALRHAQAHRILIEASWDPATTRLEVSVSDDGRGLAQSASRASGMGLENMRRRALALSAVLEIVEVNPGTRVTVSMTLPRASAV